MIRIPVADGEGATATDALFRNPVSSAKGPVGAAPAEAGTEGWNSEGSPWAPKRTAGIGLVSAVSCPVIDS
jgi:hypothetical protein